MKKFVLYRSLKGGKIDRDLGKHELVGVEYGEDIDAVTDTLIDVVCDDLAGLPEYEHCETWAYAPEEMEDFRRTKRYQYYMGALCPLPTQRKISSMSTASLRRRAADNRHTG